MRWIPRNWVIFYLSMSLGILINFQNCSRIKIQDVQAEAEALEAYRVALGKQDETLIAGTAGVPDLKMFFVVDNSGTMKANQLNLSASFGSLFDSSSDNSLHKFDTTAFIINTAQRSLDYTNSSEKSELLGIANLQKSYPFLSPMPETTFDSVYRISSSNMSSPNGVGQNSGKIPGDVLGYQVVATTGPTQYTYQPAPVMGETITDGKISLRSTIHKNASEPSQIMETDFKDRLAILDFDRIHLSLINGKYVQDNPVILDSESAMCAMARILRNPEPFIKDGDLLSFVVVSDEDDNDPTGSRCQQSVTQYDGTESLVDIRCYQRDTTIGYTKNGDSTKAGDTCTLKGSAGYKFKFEYTENVKTTEIAYKYVKTAAVYKVPYTTATYQTSSNIYSKLKTSVSFYYQICNPVYSDGVKIRDVCETPVASTGTVDSDQTSSCFDMAKKLSANAINASPYQPTCGTATYTEITGTCDTTKYGCKATKVYTDKTAKTALIGDYSATASCLSFTKNNYSDYDTTSPKAPTCTKSTVSKSSCTSAEVTAGCALETDAVIATKNPATVVDGDKTAGTGCFDWANAQTDKMPNLKSSDVSCKLVTTPTAKSTSSSISFADSKSADGGTSIAANSACGSIASLALAKAQQTVSSLSSSDKCTVTGYYAATDKTENLTSTCSSQASTWCTSENLRACSSTQNTGATTTASSSGVLGTFHEQIKTSNKCGDSVTGICGSFDPQKTICDYIKSTDSSITGCSESQSAEKFPENKIAVLASNPGSSCSPSSSGYPVYYTTTKSAYTLPPRIEVDYVAGTVKNSNNINVPASSLAAYIEKRSKELSIVSPIFSGLIQRTGDTSNTSTAGSIGVNYEALINKMKGQLDSIFSNDYSILLRDFGSVIKSNLKRTFITKKMKSSQIITDIYRTPKNSEVEVRLDKSLWKQNGSSFQIDSSLDFDDGDRFRIEFQNFLETQ
jgi:hypothetical protein